MDAVQLAQLVVTTLAPALPSLLMKIPEGAVGKIGENITDAVSKPALKLWQTLRPRLEARPAALEAAQDAASAPDDADAQAAFRRQVKKLLEADSAFAQELAALLPAATGDSVQNSPTTASGAGSVAVGISNAPIKTEIHQHQDTHHHYHGDSEKND
jgi:hypothetical protein